MSEPWFFAATATQLILAVIVFVALFKVTAPYGRFVRPGWGPTIPERWGWVVMESPSSILFGLVFFLGPHHRELVPLVFLALWEMHYINRAFITPFLTPSKKRMPVVIAVMAFAFNVLNLSINASWVSWFGHYEASWLVDPRFIIGVIVMLAGFVLNLRADAVLRRLRRNNTGYVIPNEPPFRHIVSPNYAGEILEWVGWAILTWSLPGLAFAVFTMANLVPRALSHLQWYRATFPNFPEDRRALIPHLL